MSKQEFLTAFQRAMESLGVKDQAAHYGFFEELFSDMGEEGIGEEEISARLGDPWELAASLLREEEGRGPAAGASESRPVRDAADKQTAPQDKGEPVKSGEGTWEKTWSWFNGLLKLVKEPGKFEIRMNIGAEDSFETLIPASGIEELEINWRAGELTVEAEDREDILLTEDRRENDPPMRTEIRGNCLCIYYAELPCGSKNLNVRLPAALANSLYRCTVNALSADVYLTGMIVEKLAVNTTSGSQEVRLTAEHADFSSASGDLELTVEAKELTGTTASGDISLVNTSGMSVKLSTASGDIDCRGTAKTLTLNSASGDAEFSGKAEQAKVKTASGDCDLVLDNCPQALSVTSVSGDVDVKLPRESACQLQLQSRSGDIHFSGVRTDVSDAPTFHFNTVSGDIYVHD